MAAAGRWSTGRRRGGRRSRGQGVVEEAGRCGEGARGRQRSQTRRRPSFSALRDPSAFEAPTRDGDDRAATHPLQGPHTALFEPTRCPLSRAPARLTATALANLAMVQTCPPCIARPRPAVGPTAARAIATLSRGGGGAPGPLAAVPRAPARVTGSETLRAKCPGMSFCTVKISR